MKTALYTHAACLAHETPQGHPEHVGRLRAVLEALGSDRFGALERREAGRAQLDAIARVHNRAMALAILEAAARLEGNASFLQIDADTYMSPGSGEAALRAAGAVIDAVDAVIAGEVRNAFCAVRPPGHHAEQNAPMGFCIFNNAAIGAFHALERHGLTRVAVVDFDVHHGNGTQHSFETNEGLFYLSTHQLPLYPGTGAARERGAYGNICNLPLEPNSGSEEFRAALIETGLPALEAFAPELLIISAGFDAHARDPLAGLCLCEEDFAWVTRELKAIAAASASGRIVSTLEGGYDLQALAQSAAAHVAALME